MIETFITLHGAFKTRRVFAWQFGEWAVHRQGEGRTLYAISLIRTGLSLPFVWASFTSSRKAMAAASEIARLRNDWHLVDQTSFTKELEAQLRAICRRHGAVEGPIQIKGDVDRPGAWKD